MVTAPPDGQMMPTGEIGKVIAKLIAKHGQDLLEDRRKLLGLLRDYVPAEQRGVKLLMASYDQNTPQAFSAAGEAPGRMAIDQQVIALVSSSGLQHDLAKWATEAWAAGLYDAKPAAAAPAPIPAAPAPAADDLTWGSEVASTPVTASPAAPVVMATVPPPPPPPAAPAFAPAAPPPSGGQLYHANAAAGNRFMLLVLAGIVGIVVVAVLAAHLLGYLSFDRHVHTDDAPPPDNGSTTPPQHNQNGNVPQTADQKPGDPTQPDGKPWSVLCNAGSGCQRPLFSGNHPNGPLSWSFAFNTRVPSGQLVVYRVDLSVDKAVKSGTGTIVGMDLKESDGNQASHSVPFTFTVDYTESSKDYEIYMAPKGWQGANPTNIPPINVLFSVGTNAKRFEPEGGVFCAWDYTNNQVGAMLGCADVSK